jgi:hypothetical protein
MHTLETIALDKNLDVKQAPPDHLEVFGDKTRAVRVSLMRLGIKIRTKELRLELRDVLLGPRNEGLATIKLSTATPDERSAARLITFLLSGSTDVHASRSKDRLTSASILTSAATSLSQRRAEASVSGSTEQTLR